MRYLLGIIFSVILCIIILSSCGGDKKSSENAGLDTLKYKVEITRRDTGDCNSEGSPCASIYLEFPVFEISDSGRINVLNKFMKELIVNGGYEEGENSSVEELCDAFFNDYRMIRNDLPDYTIPWNLERTIKIIYNSTGTVSIKYYEYSFSGGAHPNYITSLFSYNTKKQRFVSINDIFPDMIQRENLLELAEKKFRQIRNLGDNEDLAEAGFWFENNKFGLNNNFAVTKDGIIFFFNSYEIGPYAMGTTEIFITTDELNSVTQ